MIERFHKIIHNTQIYVWEITLSSIDLATNPLLNSEDLISAGNIKNEKRKKEFLSSRFALKKKFNKSLELRHLESGRPIIDEAEYISISHSSNFLAMAFGKENIGIDIEKPQNRMLKIIPKVVVFGFVGFAYSEYFLLILLMIISGFVGTILGKNILVEAMILTYVVRCDS